MQRALAVLVGGMVMTALGGCSSLPFLSGGNDPAPAGEEAGAEQPVAAPETAVEETSNAEAFEEPIVEAAPPPPPTLPML